MSRMSIVQSFFQGKSVLITGASSGIGEELAWQLGQAGAQLTLAARRQDRLEAIAQKIAGTWNPLPVSVECDVTRDGDLERAVAEAVRNWNKLDVVFANVALGVAAPLKKLTVNDYRRQFETNVFGVLRTIYAALPELEKSRENLAIVSSVSGWVSTPGASPYSMGKFALCARSPTPSARSCAARGVRSGDQPGLRRERHSPHRQSRKISLRREGSRSRMAQLSTPKRCARLCAPWPAASARRLFPSTAKFSSPSSASSPGEPRHHLAHDHHPLERRRQPVAVAAAPSCSVHLGLLLALPVLEGNCYAVDYGCIRHANPLFGRALERARAAESGRVWSEQYPELGFMDW